LQFLELCGSLNPSWKQQPRQFSARARSDVWLLKQPLGVDPCVPLLSGVLRVWARARRGFWALFCLPRGFCSSRSMLARGALCLVSAWRSAYTVDAKSGFFWNECGVDYSVLSRAGCYASGSQWSFDYCSLGYYASAVVIHVCGVFDNS